jgi:acetyl esterase/lipase
MIIRNLRSAISGITLVTALAAGCGVAMAQSNQPKVDADGTVRLPDVPVPYSSFASSEARAAFIRQTRNAPQLDMTKSIAEQRRAQDEHELIPARNRLQATFPVTITPEIIAGVQTDIVVPREGVSPANRNRVLINLHGGGFMFGGRYGGQIESIPIASLGRIKVVTVDYRQGPENRFPAASEDVAAVYRDLLKTYRPENIGIYGCSAGGMLTGQVLAWLQKIKLPRPGAAGMFCGGGQINGAGDSTYVSGALGGMGMPAIPPNIDIRMVFPYFAGSDINDPMVAPGRYREVLRNFPPTLIMTGTRDLALSSSVHLHSDLVDLGVPSDLHVWEAGTHCFFASATADPVVPETRQAWNVIVHFFSDHLGQRPKGK